MTDMKIFIKKCLAACTPSRSLNLRSVNNYRLLASRLTQDYNRPQVLVVGGRKLGAGMSELLGTAGIEAVETDIQHGPRVQMLCDAHALPFPDGCFDAVVVQAVLEHVFDPIQCVSEMSRVLREKGYIYAETPFLQQVHEFPYDFQRFTFLGHRLLFREFDEVESGPIAGPATALFWAWVSFLSSFSDRKYVKALLLRLALFSGFWIKYFDYFLISKEGALGGASALYFLGHKRHEAFSNDEILSELCGERITRCRN
ncbi:MAG: class I SAM-dependent methyltransferase [Candidatus Electrothrix sp. GW3-4]|uniref:class I SAM-dependent methyltransferase n=1 Tax=Candidatus Electrothrix sp. GW3-4 TaxID=3126740 RepID=UPI0030CA7147